MGYFGISAKNDEQKLALRALDNDKPITVLTGPSGVGKSLLAQAVGLEKVIETKDYKRLIYTRLQVDVGADRGFLPGNDGEKLYPYIAPFLDNLDAMSSENSNIKDYLLFEGQDDSKKKVFFDSIQSIRGRSLDGWIMIDEVQNLDIHTITAIATRLRAENAKLILLGNFSQIDDKKLRNPEQNGFYQLLKGLYEKDPEKEFFDHINMTETHRHPVVELVEDILRNDNNVDPKFYELENKGTLKEYNKKYGIEE